LMHTFLGGKDGSWPGDGTRRRRSRRSASCSSIATSTRASGERSPRCLATSAWHRRALQIWLSQYQIDTGEQAGITTDYAAQDPSALAHERASSSAPSRSQRRQRLLSCPGNDPRSCVAFELRIITDAPTGRSDLCGRTRSHGIQITSWTHDVQSRRAPSPHSLVGHRQHKRSRPAPTKNNKNKKKKKKNN